MSANGQSPFTAQVPGSLVVPIKKPTEASTSYFPEPVVAATAAATTTASSSSSSAPSRRSSVSSSVSSQARAAAHTAASSSGNPLDILSRAYPAPTEEIDVAKQLAMEPPKHSLHDSLRRAAAAEPSLKPDDAETRARKLAAAKAELLSLALPSLR